jgi:2-methylcitrate dehydratase PrpD
MTALEQLGSHFAESRQPPDVLRELVELHLIDTVGAWIASTRTAEGAKLLRFRAMLRARGQAGETLALDLATRCALARLSEIDNIHLASMTTPGAIVIPGTLTLAAATPGITAEDVIAAVVAGTEAMTRLGRALDGPSILHRGIWPTYFAAPFGMAAVAARLLKLGAQPTADALALALTIAAPTVGHHNVATTSRWLALGHTARSGLTAALAAQHGFTSDRKLIEGQLLPGVFGITPDISALTDALGERIALSDVSFKPWCGARQTMAATQAFKEIIASGVAPSAIEEVTVAVLPPHLKMIDHGVVAGDRASHLTSMHYCMAVAAIAPDAAFETQQTPAKIPQAVHGLMAKIKVAADERLLTQYPHSWPARVRVTAGAARQERTVTHVPGDPALPFDGASVRKKFLRFSEPAIGIECAERILTRCSDALASGEFTALVDDIEHVTCRERRE